jgi:hypothetical protein
MNARNSATPAKNSALASAGTELRLATSVSLVGKFDGEFAARSLPMPAPRWRVMRGEALPAAAVIKSTVCKRLARQIFAEDNWYRRSLQ